MALAISMAFFKAINDGIFLGLTGFLKFLGTRLTLSSGQRMQGFDKFNKFINFLF